MFGIVVRPDTGGATTTGGGRILLKCAGGTAILNGAAGGGGLESSEIDAGTVVGWGTAAGRGCCGD